MPRLFCILSIRDPHSCQFLLKFFSGYVFLLFRFWIWVSERDCHNEINTRGCPYMFVIRVKAVASHGDFCLVAVLFCPATGTCTSRSLLSLGVVFDSSHTPWIVAHVCVGV